MKIKKSFTNRLLVVAILSSLSTLTWAAAPVEGEQCYGAIGNKCLGGGSAIANIFVPPAQNLLNGMKRQWVSVGSILHDNCCRLTPDGQHCQGFNPAQEFWPDSRHCVKEWRKAIYNSRDHRKWKAIFGPYKDISSGDDLTEVPARKASLFNRFGVKVGYYKGTETVSTHLLKAPSGTALDIDDVAFCASGKFKSVGKRLGIGAWGICK